MMKISKSARKICCVALAVILAFWACIMVSPAFAEPPLSEERHATVISTYDGDTFTAETRIWLGQVLTTGVRLDGIDTPEIRGKCQQEKDLAIKARDRSHELTAQGVILRDIRWGKYAKRVIADVYLKSGESLAELLISEGLGRPYDGGRRTSWCG